MVGMQLFSTLFSLPRLRLMEKTLPGKLWVARKRGKKDMANHTLDFKTSGQKLHKSLLTALARASDMAKCDVMGRKV